MMLMLVSEMLMVTCRYSDCCAARFLIGLENGSVAALKFVEQYMCTPV